ncbi:GlpG protein (membrane protein of glp regulon) [Streptococcus sp. DD10]|uniref:rhomboid family intramembrane serine protease n=1 Tax=Streptococcus sp. DD10 TaxID=1777878 RepID=UPI000794C6E5|nr:rhomboid family intramembrane serine protease [Streptococcus sp. DD10]KXT74844.1 GlpG protein (membrane protein of glp regulon) [Streptococcus sp. DD10]
MKELFDKRYPVTSSLLIVSIFIFLIMFLMRGTDYASGQTLYDFGAMYGLAIRTFPNQLWRLISAIFVHIGFEHLLMNMVTLYFLGRQVEGIFGSKKFLILYLFSGLMGNVAVFLWTPNVIAAGASTSLYGLFASIIVLRYAVNNPYIQQLGQSYLILFVLNVGFSLMMPGISLAGHLGGAIGGALLAVLLPIRGERYAYSSWQRILALLVYLLLFIGSIFLGF